MRAQIAALAHSCAPKKTSKISQSVAELYLKSSFRQIALSLFKVTIWISDIWL